MQREVTMKTATLYLNLSDLEDKISFGRSYGTLENKVIIDCNFNDLVISGYLISFCQFKNVTFKGCTFYGTTIENCNFINCKFQDCEFKFCKLSHLELNRTIFSNSQFEFSPIKKSSFEYCLLDEKMEFIIEIENKNQKITSKDGGYFEPDKEVLDSPYPGDFYLKEFLEAA